MRTTINLDDNLLQSAKSRAQEGGRTLGDLVEDALHAYLAAPRPDFSDAPDLPVFAAGDGFQPDIDPASNASMFDALDDDGIT